jgi:ADP-heptose:LPS heptosyltransferase
VSPEPVLGPATARILAIRLDNVGDVVMLGPALRSIRAALPRASITLMCSPAGAQVTPLLPWIDDVLVHRAVWQDARADLGLDPDRELDLVRMLRAGAFDAALIFTSFSQSAYPPAYACYLAGIPIRAGHAEAFGGSVLVPAVDPAPWAAHQVDRNLHLVAALGIPIGRRDLELRVPPALLGAAEDLLGSAGVDPEQRYVVLAPGASCSARRYDAARFGAVAAGIVANVGLPVVVVGTERERGIESEVAAVAGGLGRRVASLVGRTSVAELAAVVAGAALVIANDSAAMHLADAFGRPVVVTFSGTDLESQWRPRRSAASLLRVATPCAPCYRFECPYDNACLDITPERIVAEALRLIGSSGSRYPEPPATAPRRSPSIGQPIGALS